jgi:succinate-semialdehyde dehydrogenase/glutarate-semialdehyde dehydrogenase
METYPLYLNGRWEAGDGTLEVEDPATGEIIARTGTVGRARVRQALEDAQAAFPAWRATTARDRGDFLLRVAADLERRADTIARLITRENGKPLAESRGEVAVSIDHLRWFAEEGRRAYGRIVPHQAAGKRHLILKQPVGVVGAITPWNFPLVLAVRKAAPALAAGCPVVLKPASSTPLCAVELARAVDAAGLPPGVFQLVVGPAADIAAEMLENPICRKITFTGSTEVGKQLIRGSASTVTNLSLELGGHAPVLVFDDADLDLAVEGAVITKFRNTGQSCIAANRIYVQLGIYDRFIERLVQRVGAMKVGNGLESGVEIGALVNQEALDTAVRHVRNAVDCGAKVACGGKPCGDRGYFFEPTILTDVPDEAQCMNEETFAPVAPVCRFGTEAEAIARANDTQYGLAAYVFTSNLNRALRVGEALEAGTVGINDAVPSTSNCPFGGFKQSGWGRELGAEGLDAFLETKHLSLGGVD